MNISNFFKLEKLKIEVYGNRLRIGLPKQTLSMMFNPESYSFSYENKFSKFKRALGRPAAGEYVLSEPAAFNVKLIIDGTGVAETGVFTPLLHKDVYASVQQFLKATADVDGDLHEPRYLRIRWGKLNFPCRLSTATVNYTLFDRNGNPLRAELDTAFKWDDDQQKALKKLNFHSPDLTHKRTVKAHDTLLLLCEAVYGTPDYYLEVAKANKLANFRVLTPGQELFFPPINNNA